ncbi:NUDIX hydrolase [Flavobacterium aquariorum]|uniref:NUDIX hydrolase n=1 Tax=Flavobacterium aquariorum TaxID=2217670 RepID=A0A2W7TRS7_9FLAO|nr:NUDIX domain-containing protein [Flavobacterium aquariorum]PZX93253.1 NUDIX hydrolase [Flavobacterium aquariorum]
MKLKKSAGILLYKKVSNQLFVLLVHPGGPFWKNKDRGHWSIPKGEFNDEEDAFDAAIREFEEETGMRLEGSFIELSPIKLKSGQIVYAWALEKDIDTNSISTNTFEMKWPPKSGILQIFPETDKGQWFAVDEALEKINKEMGDFILQLLGKIEFDN